MPTSDAPFSSSTAVPHLWLGGPSAPENSGVLQQAGVVAFRWNERSLKFCLISSRNGRRWLLPKGTIEAGEQPCEAALREAWEEAGVHGVLVGVPLPPIRDDKQGRPRFVQLRLLETTRVADGWPESFRRRVFVEPRRALQMLGGGNPYRRVVREAARRLLAPMAR